MFVIILQFLLLRIINFVVQVLSSSSGSSLVTWKLNVLMIAVTVFSMFSIFARYVFTRCVLDVSVLICVVLLLKSLGLLGVLDSFCDAHNFTYAVGINYGTLAISQGYVIVSNKSFLIKLISFIIICIYLAFECLLRLACMSNYKYFQHQLLLILYIGVFPVVLSYIIAFTCLHLDKEMMNRLTLALFIPIFILNAFFRISQTCESDNTHSNHNI